MYEPPPQNRPTWDLTSVLYAVYPDRGFFGLSDAGRVTVSDKGQTTLEPSDAAKHRFLTMNQEQRIRVIEALVQFVESAAEIAALGHCENQESTLC